MRVVFAYPPYNKNGKYPHLTQNRQVRYTSSGLVKIYPLIPASLLTMVKGAGHECLLLDAVSRRMTRQIYEPTLASFRPDVVVLETKTPVMGACWEEVDRIKSSCHGTAVVLVGDHVSAQPHESFSHCGCDYVALGGDYDVAVSALVEHLAGRRPLPAGIAARGSGSIGEPHYQRDLDTLPLADRELTRWSDYGEAYLIQPAMYVLSGRGCGRRGRAHAGCSFCSWQHNLWRGTARLRSPGNFFEEIEGLADRYAIREFFDDNESGPLWNEAWFGEYSGRIAASGLHSRCSFSTNARADALTDGVCRNLRRAGYRLLKVGLESANDATLRRLGKGETVEEIIAGVKRAKDYGLRVLLTTMVGYPWEDEEDLRHTFEVARQIVAYKCRIGDSLQCSILTPYPGTPLHWESVLNGWYGIDPASYDSYDMDCEVLKASSDTAAWCGRMWRIHLDPRVVLGSVASVRRWPEFVMGLRGVTSLFGHMDDYKRE